MSLTSKGFSVHQQNWGKNILVVRLSFAHAFKLSQLKHFSIFFVEDLEMNLMLTEE